MIDVYIYIYIYIRVCVQCIWTDSFDWKSQMSLAPPKLLSFQLRRPESVCPELAKTLGDHSLVPGLALSLQCSERLPCQKVNHVKVKGRHSGTLVYCDVAMTRTPGALVDIQRDGRADENGCSFHLNGPHAPHSY